MQEAGNFFSAPPPQKEGAFLLGRRPQPGRTENWRVRCCVLPASALQQRRKKSGPPLVVVASGGRRRRRASPPPPPPLLLREMRGDHPRSPSPPLRRRRSSSGLTGGGRGRRRRSFPAKEGGNCCCCWRRRSSTERGGFPPQSPLGKRGCDEELQTRTMSLLQRYRRWLLAVWQGSFCKEAFLHCQFGPTLSLLKDVAGTKWYRWLQDEGEKDGVDPLPPSHNEQNTVIFLVLVLVRTDEEETAKIEGRKKQIPRPQTEMLFPL